MQLTKLQLAEIKSFISRKGIKYTDVQMEIVDHVASAVEERMHADHQLTFEMALKQVHASFGIFGFGGMEDSIINGMGKKYNRLFWTYFLSLFGQRYLLLVLIGGFLIYELQVISTANFYFITLVLLAAVALSAIAVVVGLLRHKAYRNLLVYRTSIVYFMFIGSFLQIFNFVVNHSTDVVIYGIRRNFVLLSILLVLFVLYVITAIRTAYIGVKESKILLDKYKLLNS